MQPECISQSTKLSKAIQRFQTNQQTFKMFKYVIVVLALIAAAFASPKPQVLFPAAAPSYAYSSNIVRPAATVYSAGYVPSTYSSSYIAPAAATYSAPSYAAYPYAYL